MNTLLDKYLKINSIEEDLSIEKYQDIIYNTFNYIESLIKIKCDESILLENIALWEYSIEWVNLEYIDFLLFVNKTWYEVFWKFLPSELINTQNINTLKNIISWELLILYVDNYEHIILLNKSNYEQIEKIILN